MKPKNISDIILMICFVAIGIFGTLFYQEYTNKRTFDGLRFEANNSHPLAIQRANTYDNRGDWVCVNIKGMNFDRAIEVCSHEVGHEIFATICEKNITKCLEVME